MKIISYIFVGRAWSMEEGASFRWQSRDTRHTWHDLQFNLLQEAYRGVRSCCQRFFTLFSSLLFPQTLRLRLFQKESRRGFLNEVGVGGKCSFTSL